MVGRLVLIQTTWVRFLHLVPSRACKSMVDTLALTQFTEVRFLPRSPYRSRSMVGRKPLKFPTWVRFLRPVPSCLCRRIGLRFPKPDAKVRILPETPCRGRRMVKSPVLQTGSQELRVRSPSTAPRTSWGYRITAITIALQAIHQGSTPCTSTCA